MLTARVESCHLFPGAPFATISPPAAALLAFTFVQREDGSQLAARVHMLMSGAAPTGASTCAIRRHAGPRTRKALLLTISTRHLVCPGDHDAGLWIYSLIISGASGSAASVVEKQRRARSGLPEGVVETSRWQGGVTKMHGKLALFWLFSSSPPITHPPAVRLQRLRRHTRTRGFCVGFDTVAPPPSEWRKLLGGLAPLPQEVQ